jgi:hypothetical protein
MVPAWSLRSEGQTSLSGRYRPGKLGQLSPDLDDPANDDNGRGSQPGLIDQHLDFIQR